MQKDTPGDGLALISWLGGDMPDSVLMNAPSPGYYADGMAADLAGFSDALRQEINHSAAAGNNVNTTFVGHSYGGAAVGAAEQYGLNADRVLHISSAGLGSGIGSPADLPDSQDNVDRYSMTPDGDFIGGTRGFPHGGDPDEDEAITRLETGVDEGLWPWQAHSAILDDRNSLGYRQLTDLLVGNTSGLEEYTPQQQVPSHNPYGRYGSALP